MPRWSTFRRTSPPTEHPPAGIRIARSSDRPDLAQKTSTATQKIKILAEKMAIQPDGPSSKYTASRRTNLPFRYTKEGKHVRCRTSGAYEPPDRLPMRDSISETAHIRCILGAACAFWKKEARSARYVPAGCHPSGCRRRPYAQGELKTQVGTAFDAVDFARTPVLCSVQL